jgi:hypothetical protein
MARKSTFRPDSRRLAAPMSVSRRIRTRMFISRAMNPTLYTSPCERALYLREIQSAAIPRKAYGLLSWGCLGQLQRLAARQRLESSPPGMKGQLD